MGTELTRILSEKLHMDEKAIHRFCRYELPEAQLGSLERKLRFLEQGGLLDEIDPVDAAYLSVLPVTLCSEDGLGFAAAVPEVMGFSEEQRERYNKKALWWFRWTDIRPRVLPLLEKLCGPEIAHEVLCGLYISGQTTVGEDELVEICEKLLSYPDETGCLPGYLEKFWYFVFSTYSDHIAALDALAEVFREEHVLKVFAAGEDRWPKVCYQDVEAVRAAKEELRQELWKEAKEQFKDCLK
ncbi:MAG: hypothetical protein IJO88_05510 [Oscillospiraceae bacterium]|nr:hypothetical protein [Oscillospiraceae bacterium]